LRLLAEWLILKKIRNSAGGLSMYVKNLQQLSDQTVSQGCAHLRKAALLAYNSALECVEPAKLLKSMLSIDDKILKIGESNIDIGAGKVYVVGAGKASGVMAGALEQLLGDRLTAGCVNIPHETDFSTRLISLNRAGHPIPDDSGVAGCRRIIKLADAAESGDLVICLISGGGSSLLPLPALGVSLADKQAVTSLLLKSGASIGDINAVRKHLSGIKGGWLARRIYPARPLNLILSDVIGDPLEVIASGPTVPDTTTFADAVAVLQRYDLWHEVPVTARERLSAGVAGLIEETPKPGDVAFTETVTRVVGNNCLALDAAGKSLAAAGFKVEVVKEPWQGDACQLGHNLAARAVAAARSAFPVAVIMGGEATVKVSGRGSGGRNQQAALAAVHDLAGYENLLVAVLATDGIDGPTDACGAIVDGTTLVRAQKLDMKPETFLQNNDSYSFFNALGDLVHTGYTGSNVNDIYMILSSGSTAR